MSSLSGEMSGLPSCSHTAEDLWWVGAQRNDGNVSGRAVEAVQLSGFSFCLSRPISCMGGGGAPVGPFVSSYSFSLQVKRRSFKHRETEVKGSGSVERRCECRLMCVRDKEHKDRSVTRCQRRRRAYSESHSLRPQYCSNVVVILQ